MSPAHQHLETTSQIVLDGHRYWREKAAARFAPVWKDIVPAEIVKLLPSVVVYHVYSDPLDFEEQITGQRIVDNSHQNSMHVRYRDYPGRGPESEIWKTLEDVVTSKEPSFQHIPYVGPNKDFMEVQAVICPISDDGLTVNKLIGFVDYIRLAAFYPD